VPAFTSRACHRRCRHCYDSRFRPYARAALGDVIVEVAQQEVTQPQQVVAKVQEARAAKRRSVLIMVERAGEQRFVGLPVEPRG